MSAGQNGSVSAVIRVRILHAKMDAWGQTCVAAACGLVDIGAILQQQLDSLGCGPKLAGVVKGRFAVSIASVDKPRGLVAWKSVQERLQVADGVCTLVDQHSPQLYSAWVLLVVVALARSEAHVTGVLHPPHPPKPPPLRTHGVAGNRHLTLREATLFVLLCTGRTSSST